MTHAADLKDQDKDQNKKAALKILRLKKQEERRILAGHLWIFSNEVDTQATPLSKFTAGETVIIQDYRNKNLGIGYINPHTLLCARVLATHQQTSLGVEFFEEKIRLALSIRERIYDQPYYRLVFSEGDYLPGLIIDRFNQDFVIELSTAGMQSFEEKIVQALQNIFQPRSILAHHNLSSRKIENLPLENQVLYGQAPEHLSIIENDCKFITPALTGQKTGWFYDHRPNRAKLKNYVSGKTVLDLFSYVGGWSIPAAKWGASKVTAIDSSALATEFLAKNAALNQVTDQIEIITEDVFKALEKLIAQQIKFDVIVADPPAFIKKKADLATGIQGYKKLHQLCLKLLKEDGILISASCSLHLSGEELLNIIRQTSVQGNNPLRVLEQIHQGSDHPLHPAIKETAYLKGFISVRSGNY